jgi:DNA-binding NtrC family response regulator
MAKRILVVDDDRSMVQTLCDILEARGWETLRAHDGLQAVEAVAQHKVDFVLMDVKMPNLNGVEALQRMKTVRPGVRIVLMTAYAAPELLAQAERDGVAQIMRKPVDLPALLALLDSALTRRRSVLVVDDDPAYLATITEVLARHGVNALQARNLPEALDRLGKHPPGAVLLDLKLGGVNMSEHLVAFHELSPAALLVLHSGYVDELAEAVEHAPEGLVSAAFTKPMAVDDLLEFLDGHDQR